MDGRRDKDIRVVFNSSKILICKQITTAVDDWLGSLKLYSIVQRY